MHHAVRTQVDAMQPIPLGEMERARLMNRVDTKYALTERHLAALLDTLLTDYRVLTVAGTRLAPYTTLYFDTPQHTCYLQHHNGKRNRYKVRQRAYLASGAAFLELKRKTNLGRTDKQRIAIPTCDDVLDPGAEAFLTPHLGTFPQLVPQLWTRFSRLTFVHRDQQERITLDCNLSFACGQRVQKLSDLVVVEVKQTSDNRYSLLRQQLQQLGIRPLRLSKYCLGSLLLKPHLKHNRFKPKLQALHKLLAGKSSHGIS